MPGTAATRAAGAVRCTTQTPDSTTAAEVASVAPTASSPIGQGAQEVPPIQVTRQEAAIQVATLWPSYSPEDLHKAAETCDLHRRYSPNGEFCGGTGETHEDIDRHTGEPRLHSEPEEMGQGATEVDRIPWFSSELLTNDTVSTTRQGPQGGEGVSLSKEQGSGNCKAASSYHWPAQLHSPGSPREEYRDHINIPELKAVFLALQTFAAQKRDQHVLLLVDNMTAIAYLNHQSQGNYQTWQ